MTTETATTTETTPPPFWKVWVIATPFIAAGVMLSTFLGFPSWMPVVVVGLTVNQWLPKLPGLHGYKPVKVDVPTRTYVVGCSIGAAVGAGICVFASWGFDLLSVKFVVATAGLGTGLSVPVVLRQTHKQRL